MTIYYPHCRFVDWDVRDTFIFLRADLNVPLKNGTIVDDYRFQQLLPTISYLHNHSARIIIATHLGRPSGPDMAYSTKPLCTWLQQHGYPTTFIPDLAQAENPLAAGHAIYLLENLRFYPQEQEGSLSFARQLAALAPYYINDAFGVLHRHDTSVALLPTLYAPEKRSMGFLVAQELKALNRLIEKPDRPFVLILGGSKIADKIPLLHHLLPLVDHILLCPAIVFTFLAAQGIAVGTSLVDDEQFDAAKIILTQARERGVSIHFPTDYYVSEAQFDAPLRTNPVIHLNNSDYGITIGPITAKWYADIIKKSGTTLYNGLMGDTNRLETLSGAQAIFAAMAQSSGYSVITGGDSVAAARLLGYGDKVSFLSTGGGSTLAYLSGKPMPGLHVLE